MALMDVEQLEADSGISRHTWRTWIREGKIPVVRLGRRVRVREEDYRLHPEKSQRAGGRVLLFLIASVLHRGEMKSPERRAISSHFDHTHRGCTAEALRRWVKEQTAPSEKSDPTLPTP